MSDLDDKSKLALRLYGRGSEIYVDREMEALVMLLMAREGLGAPLSCQFENGLIYSWLPGRNLYVEEMGKEDVMEMVTKAMARLHAIQLPVGYSGRRPALWNNLDSWMDRLELCPPHSGFYHSPYFTQIGSLAALRSEVELLRTKLSNTCSPVVLCHNDLSSLNVIYDDTNGSQRVAFIDMEYASPNYQAFDIANHFCEFGGVHNLDYSRYPSEAAQKCWIRLYLEERESLLHRVRLPFSTLLLLYLPTRSPHHLTQLLSLLYTCRAMV